MSRKRDADGSPSQKFYSRVGEHRRMSKTLSPPLNVIVGIKPQSWHNERPPEMLWAAILFTSIFRSDAFALIRQALRTLFPLRAKKDVVDITLSGLTRIDTEVAEAFVGVLCSMPKAKEALQALLIFPDLPARVLWERMLGRAGRPDWAAIQRATGFAADHQSEAATDCRWVCVAAKFCAGQLVFPPGMETTIKSVIEYPDCEKLEEIRPTIRSMELNLSAMNADTGGKSAWPESFWKKCLVETECVLHEGAASLSGVGTSVSILNAARVALEKHCNQTRATSGLDARHDAVFGIAMYALLVVEELLAIGNSNRLLGRLGLRTILESYITLAYLLSHHDEQIWQKFRSYGASQAKLAFLKLDEAKIKPNFVDLDMLQNLANEDLWQELVDINLGHWAASDLRKMSEKAGVKEEYDISYPWTSAYTHGNWSAIRSAVFTVCINPLHRFHRVPRGRAAYLDDVADDACRVTDKMLDLVSLAFPSIESRLRVGPILRTKLGIWCAKPSRKGCAEFSGRGMKRCDFTYRAIDKTRWHVERAAAFSPIV